MNLLHTRSARLRKLRVVHGRVRHARSEGGEDAARRVVGIAVTTTAISCGDALN